MKIAVLIKQVPDTDAPVKVLADGTADFSRTKWILNPFDEIAVEQGVLFKEKFGGEVVAISVGPVRTLDSIKQALAQGADRGIHVDLPEGFIAPLVVAKKIADICEREKFDIVFAGKKSTDDDFGVVHFLLSRLLAVPCICPVEEISFNPQTNSITALRELDGNVKQKVGCDLPVVVACEKGLCVPRYPSLPNVMKAKSKPIEEIAGTPNFAGDSSVKIIRLEEKHEVRKCKMIEGSPEAAARELVKCLREDAKAI